MNKTAILVDGGFYLRKAKKYFGEMSAKEAAAKLHNYCIEHIKSQNANPNHNKTSLYRIFYYDCPPLNKKIYHPFLGKQIDYSKSELYQFMTNFHKELKHQRKLALRLGAIYENQSNYFTLSSDALKKLCNKKISFSDLEQNDFILNVTPKGVDMRIGIDIASLAYKHLVSQIILISGDSDFVPAAKLARREGIDFVLDPMWHKIRDDLYEHVDGITSQIKKPDNYSF